MIRRTNGAHVNFSLALTLMDTLVHGVSHEFLIYNFPEFSCAESITLRKHVEDVRTREFDSQFYVTCKDPVS